MNSLQNALDVWEIISLAAKCLRWDSEDQKLVAVVMVLGDSLRLGKGARGVL